MAEVSLAQRKKNKVTNVNHCHVDGWICPASKLVVVETSISSSLEEQDVRWYSNQAKSQTLLHIPMVVSRTKTGLQCVKSTRAANFRTEKVAELTVQLQGLWDTILWKVSAPTVEFLMHSSTPMSWVRYFLLPKVPKCPEATANWPKNLVTRLEYAIQDMRALAHYRIASN